MFKTIKVANNFIFSGSNCIVLFLIFSILKSTKVMWHLLRIQVRMQLFVSVACTVVVEILNKNQLFHLFRDFCQRQYCHKKKAKAFSDLFMFYWVAFFVECSVPGLVSSYVPVSLPALGAKTKSVNDFRFISPKYLSAFHTSKHWLLVGI